MQDKPRATARLFGGRYRDGWPIKLSIASVVVLSMLVLALAIISLGWQGARQSLLDTAARTASDSRQLVIEKTYRILDPAQATLRLLSSDPLAHAKTLQERLSRLRTLCDVLTTNPLASAIYVGYADGSFFLVRSLDSPELRAQFQAPEKAKFLVQSIQARAAGKTQGDYLFFDEQHQLLLTRAQPNYRFDPRSRPWYLGVSNTSATLASAPYIFFTTHQLGLTLSQRSDNAHAVFGIDVVLSDLADNLQGLRMSPRAQLALVDAHSRVVAYPDMDRVLEQDGERIHFKSLSELGEPSLSTLHAMHPETGKVVLFDVQGQEWLGVSLPFEMWQGGTSQLLMASPSDDLLGDLRTKRLYLAYAIVLLVLLLLPLGWWAGSSIGKSLDLLTLQASRMVHFDFQQRAPADSVILEVNNLSSTMDDMRLTITTFLQVSHTMATEQRVEDMLEKVLNQLVAAMRCEGGAVYLWDRKAQNLVRAAKVGQVQEHGDLSYAFREDEDLPAQQSLGEGMALLRQALRGRNGGLEGLLVVQYATDARHADPAFADFVRQLSGMLALAIETRQLIAAHRDLLDAIIQLMANAIDAKSPYTGGHCDRVPQMAGRMVDRMTQDQTGPYANFVLSEDARYAFHLAAWLHDCGKVTSPEHVIDKATKLETIYNRIHEVRMRFEVLWRDAEIATWKAIAQGGDPAALQADLVRQQAVLQDDFAFVARCNVGGEGMADAQLARLQQIASTSWVRHFDNRLGLSEEELRRLGDAPASLPVREPLLADRPEHLVPWGEHKPAVEKGDPRNVHGFDMVLPAYAQNMGELHNLAIRRGTLTAEDRFRVNDHIVQTLVMLRSLPWPDHLARVPDIASTHHEKLDGTGYPRRLRAEQLSLPERVMALVDIFEALTAADRPYKPAKTLSESLRIMAGMARDQHLDAELFRYFLHSGLCEQFAQEFLRPSQCDAVNVQEIEDLLPERPAASL